LEKLPKGNEELIKKVFYQDQKTKKIYIGGNEITAQEREMFRKEAQNIKVGYLWEIINSTIDNEANNIALKQSKDFDEVKFAKALSHWSFVFKNIITILAK
jgi:hypothetical protein